MKLIKNSKSSHPFLWKFLVLLIAGIGVVAVYWPGCGIQQWPVVRQIKCGLLVLELKLNFPEDRARAAYELGQMGTQARWAIPALIKATADENESLCSEAMTALARIGYPSSEVVEALTKVLQKTDTVNPAEERSNGYGAAKALANLGRPGIAILLEALQRNPHRRAVVVAVGVAGPEAKEAVPFLIGLLKDEDEKLRWSAVDALCKVGQPGVPALIAALKEKNARSQRMAIEILGRIRPITPETLLALAEALKDGDSLVRWYAADALKSLGESGHRILLEATKGDDTYLQK